MDVKRWNLVLYEWIKTTDLIDVTGSLDQVNLKKYFNEYRQRVLPDLSCDVVKFIETNFPDFEVLMSETNDISTQDYTYIFSLLLFHSCVLKAHGYFQNCCQKLEERSQLYIMKFFEFMKFEREKGVKITKGMLRRGIKETAQNILSPPPFMTLGSPIKTPTKLDRSPPYKELTSLKLKELKHMKVQLENERFERNLLEVEVKQNQDIVDSLVKKCKDLSREVQSLRNHMTVERDDENVDPNIQRVEQIKQKMEKEITARDDTICDLKAEIAELTQCKKSLFEKIGMIEGERKELLTKLCDFDQTICELQAEITLRDEKIQYLEESNKELVQILGEYKHQKSESSDLDSSFSTYHTVMSSLGGEMVDLQLKDKESEVASLKELLENVTSEKEDLEQTICILNTKVLSLEHDIKEHEDSKKVLSENLTCKIDLLKEKLKSTMSMHSQTEKREKELEEQLEREKIFNDKVNQSVEIMKSKLSQNRDVLEETKGLLSTTKDELEKASKENEELKLLQSKKIKELTENYDDKLEKLKGKMKSLYEDAVASHKEKFTALENARLLDNETYQEKIDQLNSTIKDLTLSNDMLVKEKQYLIDKLKFVEMSKNKSETFEMGRIAATSTPLFTLASNPINEEEEEFNNQYLRELKGEEDIDDVCAASAFQKRNSQYPPHLRDSYAIQKLDVDMNEEEIKHGGDRPTASSTLHQRKKDGTNYRRPSMLPTPSKQARPSIGSSQTLRDSTNDNKKLPKTPSKMKQFISRFSLSKDENSSNARRLSLMPTKK